MNEVVNILCGSGSSSSVVAKLFYCRAKGLGVSLLRFQRLGIYSFQVVTQLK